MSSLPANPVEVAEYVAFAASLRTRDGSPAYSPSTLDRWVSAIGYVHAQAGYAKPGADPVVANVLSGIRVDRTNSPGGNSKRQARPLMLDQLRVVLNATSTAGFPQGVSGVRDRAMLLTGWVGALRSDSVRELRMNELTWHPDDGVHVFLRRSKTDREGKGRTIVLPRGRQLVTCAPCALARWIMLVAAFRGEQARASLMEALRQVNARGGHVCLQEPAALRELDGPVFRAVHKVGFISQDRLGANAVNAVVTTRTRRAGLPGFTSHSLRAGFVTEAARQGVSTELIMRQTGQTKDIVDMYRRNENPTEANAVMQLGL